MSHIKFISVPPRKLLYERSRTKLPPPSWTWVCEYSSKNVIINFHSFFWKQKFVSASKFIKYLLTVTISSHLKTHYWRRSLQIQSSSILNTCYKMFPKFSLKLCDNGCFSQFNELQSHYFKIMSEWLPQKQVTRMQQSCSW